MTRRTRQGLRLDAEFTEETIATVIQLLLTLMSFPRQRFTVESFSGADERRLGADARLEGSKIRGFRPFYMQFKRPSAYPDNSRSKIVKQRKQRGMIVSPRSLFFELRNKQPHHHNCQHNILRRLHVRLRKYNLGDAAYVCPLFLDRSAYTYHVHLAGIKMWNPFWRFRPWHLGPLQINQIGDKTIDFQQIPIFAEHISIPPHDYVKNTNHRYSFDESGKNLCFHSPATLPDEAITLGMYLNTIKRAFLSDEGKVTPNTAYQSLLDLSNTENSKEPALVEKTALDPEDPIGSWLFLGDFLRREHNIEQFAFISWNDP